MQNYTQIEANAAQACACGIDLEAAKATLQRKHLIDTLELMEELLSVLVYDESLMVHTNERLHSLLNRTHDLLRNV